MKRILGALAGTGGGSSHPLIGKTIQICTLYVRVVRQIGEGGFSCIFEVNAATLVPFGSRVELALRRTHWPCLLAVAAFAPWKYDLRGIDNWLASNAPRQDPASFPSNALHLHGNVPS